MEPAPPGPEKHRELVSSLAVEVNRKRNLRGSSKPTVVSNTVSASVSLNSLASAGSSPHVSGGEPALQPQSNRRTKKSSSGASISGARKNNKSVPSEENITPPTSSVSSNAPPSPTTTASSVPSSTKEWHVCGDCPYRSTSGSSMKQHRSTGKMKFREHE